jgi:hypothetical protein
MSAVLDQPIVSTRVPIQYIGLARVFRNHVRLADQAMDLRAGSRSRLLRGSRRAPWRPLRGCRTEELRQVTGSGMAPAAAWRALRLAVIAGVLSRLAAEEL